MQTERRQVLWEGEHPPTPEDWEEVHRQYDGPVEKIVLSKWKITAPPKPGTLHLTAEWLRDLAEMASKNSVSSGRKLPADVLEDLDGTLGELKRYADVLDGFAVMLGQFEEDHVYVKLTVEEAENVSEYLMSGALQEHEHGSEDKPEATLRWKVGNRIRAAATDPGKLSNV